MSQSSQDTESLPATPYTAHGESEDEQVGTASGSVQTNLVQRQNEPFLWLRATVRRPHKAGGETSVAVKLTADGEDPNDSTQPQLSPARHSTTPPRKRLFNESDSDEVEEDKTDDGPSAPSRDSHTSPRVQLKWRRSGRPLNDKTSKATGRQNESDKDSESDESDALPPLSTLTARRNWRVPLEVREREAQAARARLDQAANEEEAEFGIQRSSGWWKRKATRPNDDFEAEDADLPILADTDDSELDDEDGQSLDEMEMQDYLRYRLPSGFAMLDERLGYEALHAAQFDLMDTTEEDGVSAQSGGLASGGILEVVGTPGSGKTTLLMQLALQERLHALLQAAHSFYDHGISEENSSTARQVVLIDTEGSVSPHRMARMALFLIDKILEKWPSSDDASGRPSRATMLEHTLAGIHLVRCTRMCDLLATFEMFLPSSRMVASGYGNQGGADREAEERERREKELPPNTSLILIDSVSHFFRARAADDATLRREQQHAYMAVRSFAMRVHACGFKLIASNQTSATSVTGRGQPAQMSDAEGVHYLRPSMREWLDEHLSGEAWRLFLYRADLSSDQRIARLTGRPSTICPERGDGTVMDESYWSARMPYRINEHGVLVDGAP